jgi:hypothetical protein
LERRCLERDVAFSLFCDFSGTNGRALHSIIGVRHNANRNAQMLYLPGLLWDFMKTEDVSFGMSNGRDPSMPGWNSVTSWIVTDSLS